VRGSTLCAAHDPRFQERRRAGACQGGRARGSRELATIRAELATLYADTIAGRIDKGSAAVDAQNMKKLNHLKIVVRPFAL
jgi:hypothetical protein